MNKKIDLNEVQKLYEEGLSAAKISEILKCHVNTIKNKIKELPDEALEVHKANKTNKQSQKMLTMSFKQSITQDDLKNQDEEEGWIVDIRKLKDEIEETSRYWVMVVYPESSDINQVQRKIEAKGLKAAISPLHNKDFWLHDSPEVIDTDSGTIISQVGERYKQGDRKKAHYHIIFEFDRVISFGKVARMLMNICNSKVYPRKVWSPYAMYEYLWHKNEDLSIKAHYDSSEVIRINGFVPELSQTDKDVLLREICMKIVEHQIDNIGDVLVYYNYALEVVQTLRSTPHLVQKLCDAQWYRKNSKDRPL